MTTSSIFFFCFYWSTPLQSAMETLISNFLYKKIYKIYSLSKDLSSLEIRGHFIGILSYLQ